ncbi:hypothetical protein [Imperialibacter roseus]|uniref:Uncharacterized protein n=1 Tax=Imperialibacter roseus TaxID=1324217 RepID=A0ABZ0IUH3_9BACT|nr:hypothetical protein [Imperialibacter roseus]WOK07799.1 hypothetical protein RT717_04060 [Imperialibacter roseus]|tara:strand:+ start:10704 stop:10991 length:288 start_codon:yes stop_codon:yes gene_type:complete
MHGAGFAIDAIKTLRNNRSLLKGKGAGPYKNFDTAYITDSIISRKAPVYRKASTQYLASLRAQLAVDNKRRTTKKRMLLVATVAAISLAFYFLLF